MLEYSAHVRKIIHRPCHRVPAVPNALQHCRAVFPRLTHVVLKFQGCIVPHALASSPYLQHISISNRLSTTLRPIGRLQKNSDAAALFLYHARTQAPGIHTLSIKGGCSANLKVAIASYTQLRHLSVHTSSFDLDTFAAIAAFPFLEKLDLSVSLGVGEIEAHIEPSSAIFPALRSLTLQTYGWVVEAILSLLPVDTLTELHLEMNGSGKGPGYMRNIFQCLVDRTSGSLRELQVTDRTDHEVLEDTGITQWYDLDLIRPLAALKTLRRFTLRDSSLIDADLRSSLNGGLHSSIWI